MPTLFAGDAIHIRTQTEWEKANNGMTWEQQQAADVRKMKYCDTVKYLM